MNSWSQVMLVYLLLWGATTLSLVDRPMGFICFIILNLFHALFTDFSIFNPV